MPFQFQTKIRIAMNSNTGARNHVSWSPSSSGIVQTLLVTAVAFQACMTSGTYGHIMYYKFQVPINDLSQRLDSMIRNDTALQTADYKWLRQEVPSYYFIKISDSCGTEEFTVGFVRDAGYNAENTGMSTLALVAITTAKGQHEQDSDLSENEINRVTRKFEIGFLDRLKSRYTKADNLQ